MTSIASAAGFTLVEGQNLVSLGRITSPDGVVLVRSAVSSIALKVFDLDSATPETAVHSATPTVSAVVFNTLQTDGYWDADGTGYNFRDTIAYSGYAFIGGHEYRIEYKFVTGSFADIYAGGRVRVRDVLSI